MPNNPEVKSLKKFDPNKQVSLSITKKENQFFFLLSSNDFELFKIGFRNSLVKYTPRIAAPIKSVA